ncbi:MAG: IucA/IucC family protein [Pseudobdellovibrio sp.]
MDTLQLLKIADLHSATCFLNSLFKEWDGFVIDYDNESIKVALSKESYLEMPIKKISVLGRHKYTGDFYLVRQEERVLLNFDEMIELLSSHLENVFNADTSSLKLFKKRVLESRDNILKSIKYRLKNETVLKTNDFSFEDAEQALLVGHNFHPTPKIRDQFTDLDMQMYSPEFGAQFSLQWLLCSVEILHQGFAESFNEKMWTHELLKSEKLNSDHLKSLDQGFMPVPMHPWQYDVLKQNKDVSYYIKSGKIIEFEREQRFLWKPTSSLRSLYRNDAPYMLKFSMTLKLTNSIRHLLVHEVERGLQMRDVLNTKKGQDYLKSQGLFQVISEPAYVALKDQEGSIIEESIVVCRENPFSKGSEKNKAVLATVAQDALLSHEDSFIVNLLKNNSDPLSLKDKKKKWFQNYLKVVVKPLTLAATQYGIVMGAHQQNIVLDFENGYPIKAYFRDCQGTGYTELGFSNFSDEVRSLNRSNGNILSLEMANYLFGYYLILNSTFNVISVLADEKDLSEEDLIQDLRDYMSSLKAEGVKDEAFLNYVLESPYLMHKGNFICSFKSINENTTENPLAIYSKIKNPLI